MNIAITCPANATKLNIENGSPISMTVHVLRTVIVDTACRLLSHSPLVRKTKHGLLIFEIAKVNAIVTFFPIVVIKFVKLYISNICILYFS